MNAVNVRRLRDHLVALRDSGRSERFNMAGWLGTDPALTNVMLAEAALGPIDREPTRCGTAACLAGWAQLLGAQTAEERAMPVADFAARWLGLNFWFQCEWFHGFWAGCNKGRPLADITLEEAIAFLDRQVVTADAVEAVNRQAPPRHPGG
jgi:hypothetical protein